LLCRHHGCELEIPLYPPYRFFNRHYSVFDCGGMAFSEANLKAFVRACSSQPGEPHPFSDFWRCQWLAENGNRLAGGGRFLSISG
jgi:hypothetical protein